MIPLVNSRGTWPQPKAGIKLSKVKVKLRDKDKVRIKLSLRFPAVFSRSRGGPSTERMQTSVLLSALLLSLHLWSPASVPSGLLQSGAFSPLREKAGPRPTTARSSAGSSATSAYAGTFGPINFEPLAPGRSLLALAKLSPRPPRPPSFARGGFFACKELRLRSSVRGAPQAEFRVGGASPAELRPTQAAPPVR